MTVEIQAISIDVGHTRSSHFISGPALQGDGGICNIIDEPILISFSKGKETKRGRNPESKALRLLMKIYSAQCRRKSIVTLSQLFSSKRKHFILVLRRGVIFFLIS